MQLRAAPATRGRILSTVAAIEDGTQALGVLAAGLLADRVPIVPAFSVQAGVWVTAGLLSLALLDRGGATSSRARRARGTRTDRVVRAVPSPAAAG